MGNPAFHSKDYTDLYRLVSEFCQGAFSQDGDQLQGKVLTLCISKNLDCPPQGDGVASSISSPGNYYYLHPTQLFLQYLHGDPHGVMQFGVTPAEPGSHSSPAEGHMSWQQPHFPTHLSLVSVGTIVKINGRCAPSTTHLFHFLVPNSPFKVRLPVPGLSTMYILSTHTPFLHRGQHSLARKCKQPHDPSLPSPFLHDLLSLFSI